MKRILTLIMGIALTLSAMAVPARRVVKTVTLTDGKTVEVTLRGDENFHMYVDAQGQAYRRLDDGTWTIDTRDVRSIWREKAAKRAQQREAATAKTRALIRRDGRRRAVGDGKTFTGNKKGLLILVNFKDVKLQTSTANIQTVYNQMVNSEGNPFGDNHGSIHEYFRDQSYGALNVTFDVVGPVTMTNNMSYYGGNDSEGNDQHPEEMIVAALNGVKNQVNFSDYDWDGDGEVENVYVIYAGYGEADYDGNNSENTIWPHQWDLASAGKSFSANGVKVNTYACGAELDGYSGELAGIGTMCHEYSHCLGLPDFYDIDYSGGHGMMDWDIMDAGSYNGGGYCPAGYTAYEREYSGWLTYTELTTYTEVTDLPNIEDNPVAYVVRNDKNSNEYYVLANHQQKGWNQEEAGHGMLIIHVDYDKSVWEANGPNDNPSRQRMTIIPADNKFDYETYNGTKYYYGNDGDTWPGTKNKTALTDTSTPKASLYNANTDGQKLMHKEIEDIAENSGLISFTFMKSAKPKIPSPTLNEIAVYNASSFTATWDAVENAQSYNLQYRTVTYDDSQSSAEDALLMKETFAKLRVSQGENESEVSSSSLKNDADNSGWTGEKVFKGYNGLKLGSGNYGGNILSPSMTCTSGTISLYVCLAPWLSSSNKADTQDITIALRAKGSTSNISKKTFSPSAQTYYVLTFNNVPGDFQIYIGSSTGKRRFYVSLFMAFDGEFTKEDMAEVVNGSSSVKALAPQKVRTIYGAWQSVTGLTGTSHTVTGLQPETIYEVQVQAVGAEGESDWSAKQTVTLPSAPVAGDANNDGVVDNEDVQCLLRYILGLTDDDPTGAPTIPVGADMNGDGQFTIGDLIELISITSSQE